MKKLLLFASAIALVTSCTKADLDGQDIAAKPVDGISFQASIGNQTKAEWSKGESQFNMIWYAEADQIAVFYKGAKKDAAAANTEWDTTDFAHYKATRSMSNGMFTATASADILSFEGLANEASFVAVWPSSVTTGAAIDALSGKFTFKLPSLTAQTQTDLSGSSIADNIFMYSELNDVLPTHSYESVADLLKLNFVRPLTAMTFQVKGYDKDAAIYGKLKSISMTALGERAADYTPEAPKYAPSTGSIIDYSDATFDMGTKKVILGTNAPASTLKLKIGTGTAGLDWKDDAVAYMAINNVDRNGKAEDVSIAYEFENTTITKVISTSKNWPTAAGAFIEAPVFDFDSVPYNVIGTAAPYTLIINSDISSSLSGLTKIDGKDITDFGTIISRVELAAEGMAMLNKFTGLTSLTLDKNTTLAKDDLKDLALETLDMPLLTSIDKEAFGTGANLEIETLNLPSYKFNNKVVSSLILKAANLVTVNLSAVDKVGDNFNKSFALFQDFINLEEVTLNPTKVELGANAFRGCKKLGSDPASLVNFDKITYIGQRALGETGLTSFTVNEGIVIDENAFEKCLALVEIKGAPKTIANTAFTGCIALTTIDVSKVETLGANAFNGCIALVELRFPLLTVLNKGVFAGAVGLKSVAFEAVTSIVGDSVFISNTVDMRIGFDNVFTVAEGVSLPFGTTIMDQVKLYVNPDQPGVDVGQNKLTYDGGATTFKDVVREKLGK